MNIKLVQPSQQHKEGYHSMIKEFLDNSEEIIPKQMKFKEEEIYETFLLRIQDQKEGKNLKPWYAPWTLYFIVDKDEKVIWWSALRHYLTPALLIHWWHIWHGIKPSERWKWYATQALNLALLEAKKLWIEKVMLTCDKNNLASARTIIKNWWILDSEYIHEWIMIQKRRINI
jgi:predicted acetyltransferase